MTSKVYWGPILTLIPIKRSYFPWLIVSFYRYIYWYYITYTYSWCHTENREGDIRRHSVPVSGMCRQQSWLRHNGSHHAPDVPNCKVSGLHWMTSLCLQINLTHIPLVRPGALLSVEMFKIFPRQGEILELTPCSVSVNHILFLFVVCDRILWNTNYSKLSPCCFSNINKKKY